MYCAKCGTKNEEGIKFCAGCGTPVAAKLEPEQKVHRGEEAATREVSPGKDSEYINKAKEQGKQFYGFAKQVLGGPFRESRVVGKEQKVNAMITIGLVLFLIPLFAYFMLNKMADGFGPFFGYYYDVPFGEMVLKPFILLAVFTAVYIGVQYWVAKMMKVSVDFMTVLAKYGVLSVLPLVGLVIASLLMVVNVFTLALFLFLVSVGIFSLAGSALLFSLHSIKKEERGLDVFYGLIITNAVMYGFYYIVGSMMMDQMF
ncbi:zinc ribbon domain-containing protein [Halobacillus sp. KGW1]|uniref:zinc ribbon domain-containing protein n=1 Tax=Halobacillus sp. KGW1 TaxID=1793726 RepID=UPI0007849920|nr:zinc ribbon domain-containing protein [Halobacillus sp. KGW1]